MSSTVLLTREEIISILDESKLFPAINGWFKSCKYVTEKEKKWVTKCIHNKLTKEDINEILKGKIVVEINNKTFLLDKKFELK